MFRRSRIPILDRLIARTPRLSSLFVMKGITTRELDRLSVPWRQIKQLVYKGYRGGRRGTYVPDIADLSACGPWSVWTLAAARLGGACPRQQRQAAQR